MENVQPKQEGTVEPGDQSDASSTPSYNTYVPQMNANMQRGFQPQDYYGNAAPVAKGGMYPQQRAAMGAGPGDMKADAYAQAMPAQAAAWAYNPHAGAAHPQAAWDHMQRPGDAYGYQAPAAAGYPSVHR